MVGNLTQGDRLVLGPDRSDSVARIRARKAAAEAISRATLEALDRGGDATTLLTELARTRGAPNDYLAMWSGRIAGLLLRAPNPRVVAEQLFRIPNVSNLHRNQ